MDTIRKISLTRDDFAQAVLADANSFDGKRALVEMQRRTLTGELIVSVSGKVRIVLDEGTDYFDQGAPVIFDPAFNNYTPHVLDKVVMDEVVQGEN